MLFSLSSTMRTVSADICVRPGLQREDEPASAPVDALDPDPAAVELHEPLGQSEAEARALAEPDPDVRLLELLEDALAVLGSNSRPRVGDRHAHLAVDPSRAHVDGAALRGELDGVREEVEDDLPDPAFVAFDRIDARVSRELHLHAVLARTLAHHDDAALECVAQREGRQLELGLPGF